MKFCKDCGIEVLEEELKIYSGRCQACQQLLSEDMKEQSIYPKYYPRELKHLDKHESINDEDFKTTQVPTIEEIKWFPKPKSGGLNMISEKGKTGFFLSEVLVRF